MKMGIQLVVLDGDGVIWDHQDISGLTLPFKLIDENTVMDAEGKLVHLTKGMRELLKGLVTRGVIVALASWNKPEYVTQALHLFNIDQYFEFIEAQFHPNKHLMIREILRKLERKVVKLRTRQILYVDDRTRHFADIRKEIGNVLFLQMNVDIKNPLDVLKYLNKP